MLEHLIWRVMSPGDKITIDCLMLADAENSGLQKLEDGANAPRVQKSTE